MCIRDRDRMLVRCAPPKKSPDSRQAVQMPARLVPKCSSRVWAMTPRKRNSSATPTVNIPMKYHAICQPVRLSLIHI